MGPKEFMLMMIFLQAASTKEAVEQCSSVVDKIRFPHRDSNKIGVLHKDSNKIGVPHRDSNKIGVPYRDSNKIGFPRDSNKIMHACPE